jgi:hypothetical protein
VDLLSIVRKVWRYKLVTLPVILLTLCGAVYVVAIKEPVYEASSSYVMLNPPEPPTEEQIARDPSLRNINADNPYARFSDQTVMVEVLSSRIGSESSRRALLKAGADPRYELARDSDFGFSSPIVKITARAASPAAAISSVKLVSKSLTRELDRMQRDVDARYRIKANQIDPPDHAELKASGQLRMLVGVMALGAVLLFIVVSVAEALATLRRERLGPSAPAGLAGNGEPWPVYDGRGGGLAALDAPDWVEVDDEAASGDQLISLFPDGDSGAAGPTNGRSVRQRPYPRKQLKSGG